MNRKKKQYQKEIIPKLMKSFSLSNKLEAPQMKKIIINTGINQDQGQKEAIKSMVDQIALVTGQRPTVTRARKSIAGFALREGDAIGVKVTLRGQKMYDFFDKLVSIALPRVKDFQGVKRKAFDGQGNYSLGLTEQLIFPEVNYDKIDRIRGMQITIVTSTNDDEQALKLLELLGIPFVKEKNGKKI